MATKKTKVAPAKKAPAPYVVVRTYSAGVHVGVLGKRAGEEVTLTDARRIWRWNGANTLHEIAKNGIDVSRSRVSDAVESITLRGWIEIIPCSPKGEASLRCAGWTA